VAQAFSALKKLVSLSIAVNALPLEDVIEGIYKGDLKNL